MRFATATIMAIALGGASGFCPQHKSAQLTSLSAHDETNPAVTGNQKFGVAVVSTLAGLTFAAQSVGAAVPSLSEQYVTSTSFEQQSPSTVISAVETMDFSLPSYGDAVKDAVKSTNKAAPPSFNPFGDNFGAPPAKEKEEEAPKLPEISLPSIPKPEIEVPKLPEIKLPSKPEPVEAPSLPEVSIPKMKFDAPKLDMPKFDAPKVDMPKFDAPKVDMPKFDAPKVDMPKFDAPKVDIPKFDAPKVDIPKFDAPKVDIPKFDAPKVDIPKFDAPKVDLPKFDAPKVNIPKFDAPKLDGMPEIKMPEIKVPKDTVKIPQYDLDVPKVDVPKVSLPNVNVPNPFAGSSTPKEPLNLQSQSIRDDNARSTKQDLLDAEKDVKEAEKVLQALKQVRKTKKQLFEEAKDLACADRPGGKYICLRNPFSAGF